MSRIEILETSESHLEVYQCGEGDTLALCLHGFPEHAISWRNQLQPLVELGYSVWVPNLRGYGNSSRPSETGAYRMNHLLQDIADLIDLSGKQQIVLIGHDWGALLCWFFAIKKIRRVAAMMVVGIYHPAMIYDSSKWQQILRSASYIPLILLPGVAELTAISTHHYQVRNFLRAFSRWTNVDKKTLAFYLNNLNKPGAAAAMASYYRANLTLDLWQRSLVSQIVDIPVLMINGNNDPWIGTEMIEGTERFAPNLSAYLVENAAHWPHMEQPEKINTYMSRWLENNTRPHVV